MSLKKSNKLSVNGIEVIRQNFSDIDQQAVANLTARPFQVITFGILEDSRTNAHRLRQVINQIFIILKTSPHCFAESLSNRFQIARYACAYINDHRGIDISISDLCRLTGVSRRTLEYSFHDCIGQSPVAYLRSIKLNEIRRALLSPENTQKSIGDIVSDWGVWHLSRFAQYYRNQFNELPSETRKFSLS